ncbi:unnamed protein product, partial [marine sediment metagenome]
TTWQAIAVGGMVETTKFLEMAGTESGSAELNAVNIPCIEIGKATLTGSSSKLDVHMNDVTFFAYSIGDDPRIWATNDVGGTYSSIPETGHTVNLSGGGLNADFETNTWDSGNWGANVSGSGTYSGTGTMNGSSIQMNGGAAGTYTDGSFTGTGAGVARPQ